MSVNAKALLKHPLAWAMALWVAGLCITVVLTSTLNDYQRERLKGRFDTELQRVIDDIQRRFQTPAYGLMGARGVYAASQEVSRQEFARYVQSRDLEREFPGVRGMGFIERVQRDGLDDFIQREKADGAPGFAVRSLGATGSDHYVIKFIEPLASNRGALGLDVGSEAVRREGVERAARSGKPALSGVIRLVQDNLSRPGFLLYVPVYWQGMPINTEGERQAALHGFVYSPIVLDELLEPSQALLRASGLHVQITDKSINQGEQVLYAIGDMLPAAQLRTEVPLVVNGMSLFIQAQSGLALEASANHALAFGLGGGGVLLTTLLCWVFWLQATGRDRADAQALRMTAELRKLAIVAERTANAVVVTDANMRITWVNEGFTRICGYTLEDALGRRPGELLGSGLADPDTLDILKNAFEQGVACQIEILNRAKDGHNYWLATEVQPIRDNSGQLTGFIEIGLDVSKERDSNERLQLALWEAEAQKRELDLLARVARETTNAVVLTDTQGSIEWVNEGFTRITGYSMAEALGQKPGAFLQCPETDPLTKARIREAVAKRMPCKEEILNRTKDGIRYWLSLEINPLFDDEGRHTGFMAIENDVTERRAAEHQLKQALSDNLALLKAIDQGTIYSVADLQGNIVDVNEAFVHISGYLREELIGSNHRLLKSGEQPAAFWHQVWAAISSGQMWRGEVCNRKKNGELYWVESTIIPTLGVDGLVQRYISIRTDITEKKRSQAAIESQRKRLDNILRGTHAGTWEWHVPSGRAVFNERWAEIVGYTLAELEPVSIETWTRFAHPDDLQASGAVLERHFKGELDFYEVESRMRHRDGHWVWVLDRGQLATRETDGSPGWMYGTHMDITEQRERQRRIAADEMRLRAIYEVLPVGISITDAEGTIIDCNPASERMLGLSKAEHLVRNQAGVQWEIYREDGLPMPADEFPSERALKHKVAVNDVTMQVVAGDHRAWLSVSAMPVAHEDFGVVIAYQDVTEKKAQADALLEAKEQAEQASQSKSQFLANMSHEIRTPMNAILGMVKLMQSMPLQPRLLDYVQKTESAAQSLLHLLNDILDFSKVEAGKMELDLQPFRLDHLMRDLSVIFSANLGKKPVEVLFDIDPHAPRELMGDRQRLQQILINLGGNAIKFTERGEVVVRIGMEGLETMEGVPGDSPRRQARLRFSVKDSGIGIAPENQQKIFTGFTQAEASTTRRFGGTGLGLSISRRLIEMMGGQLQLESALGQGSTFSFNVSLPLAGAEDNAGHGHANAPAAQTPWCVPGLAVLVVDDNPVARELMAAMGHSLGWAVDTADSGSAALERITKRRALGTAYHAVFIDWMMPGLDGWQTSAQIRSLLLDSSHAGNTRVIMMVSAYGREMLSQQTTEVQDLIDGCLVKPATASMLFDAMQAVHERDGGPPSRPNRVSVTQPLAGLRILLVEDNAINQQVADELLTGQGAKVDIAGDGRRGVEAVQASFESGKPYDTVLMDMQMPVLDGISAAREIRSHLEWSALPIIAMTANAMASDREACLAAGMNDHVGKPFDLDQLVATLLHWTVKNDRPSMRHAAAPGEPVSISAPTMAAPLLNREVALQRVGGSKSLLDRLTTQFLRDLPNLLQACEAASPDDHDTSARRALHSLKGVASTIGADALAAAASEAEQHSLAGKPVDVPGLHECAARTRHALLEFGPDTTAAAATRDPAKTQVITPLTAAQRQSLERLLSLLNEADMSAFDAVEVLMETGDADPARWTALQTEVWAMEFDRAAVIVRQWLDCVEG